MLLATMHPSSLQHRNAHQPSHPYQQTDCQALGLPVVPASVLHLHIFNMPRFTQNTVVGSLTKPCTVSLHYSTHRLLLEESWYACAKLLSFSLDKLEHATTNYHSLIEKVATITHAVKHAAMTRGAALATMGHRVRLVRLLNTDCHLLSFELVS